jgi:hypothetical protein
MTAEAGAIAGVNADFFNISEEHPGVTPTGSSDGPEIVDGHALKAAVPNSQRSARGSRQAPRPATSSGWARMVGRASTRCTSPAP